MTEPSTHRSVSQLSSWSKCGEQYRLERIARAPAQPAAWFAQGTAFHAAIELYEQRDRQMHPDNVAEIFKIRYDQLIEQEKARQPDLSRWLTGGRTKAADDITRRRSRGLEQIAGYLRYASSAPERVWRMWGWSPAVEVEFRLDLDGIEVIGYIDQLVQWPTGQVGPRDLKTGTKRPDWALQLGVYRLAVQELFDFLPAWGDFYMAKDSKPDPPVDLTRFTRERVTRWFHDMDAAVKSELYVPNPGDYCRVCGVAEYCSAVGPRADEYPLIPQEV